MSSHFCATGGGGRKEKEKKKEKKKKSVLIRFYDNRNIKKTIFVSCCSTRYRNCRESLSSVNPPRNKAEREREREREGAREGEELLTLYYACYQAFSFSFLFFLAVIAGDVLPARTWPQFL